MSIAAMPNLARTLEPYLFVDYTNTDLVLGAPLWLPRLKGSPFSSVDSNGHVCTVTGALWTPQGRSFDGADDYIDVGDPLTCVQNTGVFTLCAWVKLTDHTAATFQIIVGNTGDANTKGFYFTYANNAAPLKRLEVYISNGTGTVVINSKTDAQVLTDNNWHMLSVTGDGTNIVFYVDTTAYAGTGTIGTLSSGASTRSLTIGADHSAAAGWTSDLTGIIGGVLGYSRILTPLEIQNIYLATKWRYESPMPSRYSDLLRTL